eukprot:1166761_1
MRPNGAYHSLNFIIFQEHTQRRVVNIISIIDTLTPYSFLSYIRFISSKLYTPVPPAALYILAVWVLCSPSCAPFGIRFFWLDILSSFGAACTLGSLHISCNIRFVVLYPPSFPFLTSTLH